jgi:hypothetical protein
MLEVGEGADQRGRPVGGWEREEGGGGAGTRGENGSAAFASVTEKRKRKGRGKRAAASCWAAGKKKEATTCFSGCCDIGPKKKRASWVG